MERSARCRKAKEGWRPRRADRSALVGNRIVAGPRAATRPEAPLQARCGNCNAASARGCNGRRGGERDRLAASYGSRRLLGNLEEKARAVSRFGPRGAWPCLRATGVKQACIASQKLAPVAPLIARQRSLFLLPTQPKL